MDPSNLVINKSITAYSENGQTVLLNLKTLAYRIANEELNILDQGLTKQQMLELAPHLTYLRLSDSSNYCEELIGEMLEKSEQLTHLVIRNCDFTGEAFRKFKNVAQLRSLEIHDKFLQKPLPEGMGALQKLVISSGLYNQPFPDGMGDLEELTLIECHSYTQPFPEKMDALKELTVTNCSRLDQPLPRKMDALVHLNYEYYANPLPESMLALRTINARLSDRTMKTIIKPLLGIYRTDRDRSLQLASQTLGMDQRELMGHLFPHKDDIEHSEINKLIDLIGPAVLSLLIRNPDVPFVHDDILKDDPLQQLHIYYIFSTIISKNHKIRKHLDIFKKILALVISTPINPALKLLYEKIQPITYEGLEKVYQMLVAEEFCQNLDVQKRIYCFTHLLWSPNRDVLLNNLKNLEKSGLLTSFPRLHPMTDQTVQALSREAHFTGNLEADRQTHYQLLANQIAFHKTPILSSNLSEDEMVELAPYLTYLDLMDSTDRLYHTPWIPDDRVDEFMGMLLEKTERLRLLRIKSILFDGSALARIKNVDKLESLEISDCPNFNQPLPPGMVSLGSLVIRDCNAFNQPLSVTVAQLDNLVVQKCNFLKSNSLLNSIMPIYKIDRERGLKLGASLGFDAEFLQIYSGIWSEGHEPDSDTYYRTLAKFIADKKIPIQKFKLSKDEFLELAPYLTYLNFTKHYKTYDDDFFYALLAKTEKLEHLIIRDMSLPLPRFNAGNLQTLEIIEGATFIDALPEGMSALRKLVIAHCPFFNKPLPKGMVALESLHFYDCESYNQRLPEGLSALKELSFDNCFNYNQPLPQGMTALESIGIEHCRSFNRDTLLPVILPIYEVDHDRGTGLAASLGILDQLRLYINLCESNDDATIASKLTQLIKMRITLPPSGLSKFVEFAKKKAGRKFVRKQRKEFLDNPQLRELLFSIYPPNKKRNFVLYNKVRLKNKRLYLTLLPKTALDVPDALFGKIKKHLIGPERVDELDVMFHGSAGIDEGGLSRQLVAQLLPQLLTRSKIFKFEPTANGKVIPQATTTLTNETIENYRALGLFLGIAYCQKNPTGEVFSEKWLQCIYSLKDHLDNDIAQFIERMDNAPLKMFMEDCTAQDEQLMKPYGTVLVSQDETEVIATATMLNSVWEDDDLKAAIESGNIDEIRKIVRREWVAPNVITYLKMAQAMVRGFKEALSVRNPESLDTFWTDLQFMKAEEFSERLQGKLSAEWIAKKITVTPENSPKAIEVKAWLEEWLDNHKDKYQLLANLVQTLTGARALLAPVKFKIRSGSGSVFPHTCSSEVDVPDNIDKDTFMAILDAYGEGNDLAFTRM